MTPDIKQEAEEYDIPENCLEVDMDVESTPKRTRKKNFLCKICNKTFKDNYKLKRHEKVHIKAGEMPEEPEHEPDVEPNFDDSEVKIEKDIDEKDEKPEKPKKPKKEYTCNLCFKTFKDNYKLKRHSKVHQMNKEPENIIDGQELAQKYDSYIKEFFKYEESILKENGKVGMKYSCLMCLPVIKVLVTNKNPLPCLNGHVKSVHSQFFPKFEEATQSLTPPGEPKLPTDPPFLCPECKEEFPSNESLKSHWQSSHKKPDNKSKTLLCNLCGKTLARNDSLTRHLWNEHKLGKPQEQVCNICGKTIQGSKSKLIKHVNEKHKGIKDHVCHLCGAGFSRPSTLKYHTQRIHEHSGKYACIYCDYKTVIPKHLEVHVNAVHTKAVKYSCEDCNFSCYTKGNLTAHKKTVHLKLKPHKCPVCPEAYVRRNELEKHMSIAGH